MSDNEYRDCRKEYQTVHQRSALWFHNANPFVTTSL
jgi:hypothetical protein